MKNFQNKTGFTLIEMMIVLGIFMVLGSGIFVYLLSWQQESKLDDVASELIINLQRCQAKAQASLGNSECGLYFSGNFYYLFKGASFATRDPSDDEIFTVPEIITISTNFSNSIYFSKYSGNPSVAGGLITLNNVNNEDSAAISINSLGLIEQGI